MPSEPVVFAGGHVALGGDVSASYGSEDNGYYTYTDYEYSSLRRFRAGLSARVTAGDHFAVLGEFRIENARQPYMRVLYGQVMPWTSHRFGMRVGRLPPTFGAFAARAYAQDNLLIGYPLGYQYLTSLRTDALPANGDELIAMRGRGWLSSFSLGNPAPDNGVPLAETTRGDTGVQAYWSNDRVDLVGSATTGTLANPLVADDNDEWQWAGRVSVKPIVGLILGASVSRGPFITSRAAEAAAAVDAEPYTQAAWGADAEYSVGYFLVRLETIVSSWSLPQYSAPLLESPLPATAISIEGRYKIIPGLYAAARFDRLTFSTIEGSAGSESWEAPVSRFELGGGYSLQRNVMLKASYQHNARDTAYSSSAHLLAAEVVFWF
jgi:hypothetical protein